MWGDGGATWPLRQLWGPWHSAASPRPLPASSRPSACRFPTLSGDSEALPPRLLPQVRAVSIPARSTALRPLAALSAAERPRALGAEARDGQPWPRAPPGTSASARAEA